MLLRTKSPRSPQAVAEPVPTLLASSHFRLSSYAILAVAVFRQLHASFLDFVGHLFKHSWVAEVLHVAQKLGAPTKLLTKIPPPNN